jgi:amidase
MNQVNLAFTSALEQAKLIRQGEISPLELVNLYLDRIETQDQKVGSYYFVARDQALADAKAKTEQLAKTGDRRQLPPFFGVSTAIKDLFPVVGMPCSYGIESLKQKLANYDDGIVTSMKQAGFIILGKTAASQMGSLPYTEPPGFLPTRNPWNLDYTPGGSSGGAAAAVAAGFCAIAQGNDGGGSIRGPAACCGLVGIKPSRGRVSNAPMGDYQNGIATHGPIARNIADAAALLDIISGYRVGDPYWLPEPEISFLEATKRPIKNLKIAFSSHVPSIGKATELYQNTLLEMAQQLSEIGHFVEESCPDITGLVEPFKQVWQAGVTASSIPLGLLSPINQWLGKQTGSAGDYLKAVGEMQVISRKIVAFFEKFDVLLMPVYLHPPIKIGEWENLDFAETITKVINWVAPCPPVNASGLPAIALPTGKFDPNGLPIGIQIIGKPASEVTLIALASQLEARIGFNDQIPRLKLD